MHPQVFAQLARVGEATAALATGERPLATVPKPMGPQQGPQLECQAAVGASEGLPFRVQPPAAQLPALAEGTAALGRSERPLHAVHTGVVRKPALPGGAPATHAAGRQLLPTEAGAELQSLRASRPKAALLANTAQAAFSPERARGSLAFSEALTFSLRESGLSRSGGIPGTLSSGPGHREGLSAARRW